MFSLLIGGLASGSSVLCSQYYGRQDLVTLRKVVSIALKISLGLSSLFVLLLLVLPMPVMRLFTLDREVIHQGALYFRVVAVSYLCYGVTTIFLIALRSVQDVKLSLRIYGVSLLINIFFNYMFIFGKFGAPKLGIVGAAIGTVIARLTELIMVLFYLKYKEKTLQFRISMLKLYDKRLLKDMVRYGLPVTAGEFLWGLGISVHCAILGHMGATAVAANSICNVLHQFMLSFVQGMGSAAAVMIGAYIGAGMYQEAKAGSKVLVRIFALCGITMGVFILLISEPFFAFYNLQAGTLKLARQFILVYAMATLFRSISGPTLCGIFWGSGDTIFSAKVDIGFLWALIPVGLIAAFALHLSPAIVLLILRMETLFKTIVALYHLRGTRWI